MRIRKIEPVGQKPVYDISVKDAEHYVLKNGVVTHNTGGMYSANQVFIISKAQEKDGKELLGYKFTINIEKSRYVREKSKFPFTVFYKGGVNKWSGLLDMALEADLVRKPSMGWYSRIDPETGEIEEKRYRAKDTNNKEFWDMYLNSDQFEQYIKNRYQIGGESLISDDIALEIDDDDDLIEEVNTSD